MLDAMSAPIPIGNVNYMLIDLWKIQSIKIRWKLNRNHCIMYINLCMVSVIELIVQKYETMIMITYCEKNLGKKKNFGNLYKNSYMQSMHAISKPDGNLAQGSSRILIQEKLTLF
jgi:hypothetical protein